MDIPNWREALSILMTPHRAHEEELVLYVAGKRFEDATRTGDYSRIFPRDLAKTIFLLNHSQLLAPDELDRIIRSYLLFCASLQGVHPDPVTAEEPGKFPHEFPGVAIGEFNTAYCACDIPFDFLIICELYAERTRDTETIRRLTWPIAWAFQYVRAHMRHGLFLEDPKHCGADRFALRATYWVDCGIPGREGRQLRYPVSFLLVQAQLIAALRALWRLSLQDWFPAELRYIDDELRLARDAFRLLYDQGEPQALAHDAISMKYGTPHGEPIHFLGTDIAHALYYLDPEDVSDAYRLRALDALSSLETPWGWLNWKHDPEIPGMSLQDDPPYIWPWYHPFIMEAAEKHGIADALGDTAFRPSKFLASESLPYCEFIRCIDGNPEVGKGCHIQLWTVGHWSWVEGRKKHQTSP